MEQMISRIAIKCFAVTLADLLGFVITSCRSQMSSFGDLGPQSHEETVNRRGRPADAECSGRGSRRESAGARFDLGIGMSSRICTLLTILAVGMSCCFAAVTNAVIGVRTNFAPEAVLSSDELATVIDLAKQCGIPEVTEIYTFNNHLPSSYFSIGAKSAEVTRGRRVTFVTVQIDREKWSSKEMRRSSDIFKSAGDFWVARGGVTTNILTTFSVSGRTARVRLSDAIPLATADKIVEAFASGKIRYTDKARNEELKGVSLSQPIALDRDHLGFAISFSPSKGSVVWVFFTLETDGVTVTSIESLVS